MELGKHFTRPLAILLSLFLAATLVPLTAFAADGECTHTHDGDCGYIEGITCAHERDEHDAACGFVAEVPEVPCDLNCEGETHADGCAFIAAVPGADCIHTEHDALCGFLAPVDCTHEHNADCGGLPPAEPGEQPAVTFTITGESEYGGALYLDANIPVTDDMLLAGVSAVDENGVDLTVTVTDWGGLNRENPEPKGEPGNPEPYIVTYTCGGGADCH